MVATPTSIYCGKESPPIPQICTKYRSRPARVRLCQNNRSVAQSAEYFRGGARAIGTIPGNIWAVRYRATAFRSPCRHYAEKEIPSRLQKGLEKTLPYSRTMEPNLKSKVVDGRFTCARSNCRPGFSSFLSSNLARNSGHVLCKVIRNVRRHLHC
jgi:hypothetical protein